MDMLSALSKGIHTAGTAYNDWERGRSMRLGKYNGIDNTRQLGHYNKVTRKMGHYKMYS